ncbi:MAG: hypothetical protein A4E34_00416 [Methanoregula sp. PtaU1.Bin006]|nr:MAG: hypothetical protein A4E33_00728 [Methanoregula sp. PtaB.Bin085]OPY36012.1 MAG: hypothetical protein A4E34_00416 [Methanoregula sp. PtaU1.Bin006]
MSKCKSWHRVSDLTTVDTVPGREKQKKHLIAIASPGGGAVAAFFTMNASAAELWSGTPEFSNEKL